jgi:acetylornithine deacetylase/succinyl-diaminopimelate desuccinylase-like protein
MSTERALAYARAHSGRFVADLKAFIRIPSVSALPRHASDVARCARWLAAHLRGIGLNQVGIISTPGHPIVYGEWRHAAGQPTLLIYGHYDVLPADPISEWRSPPFEPTIRGESLFGRGACDDKGQMLTHLEAVEAYLQTARSLPVNVKCIFEGEEEIGSPNLAPFIARNKGRLAADAVVMSDTTMLGPEHPAITYGMRGALYLELEVHGPEHDLHSGNFGGAIHNPLQALCEIIAKLHDRDGRIAIPGIYDRVQMQSLAEHERMTEFGASNALVLEVADAQHGWGERGYSLYERLTVRPALTVNGISGGYRGPGGKGVIPRRAVAKLSFRLVPHQNPREVDKLFRAQIARLTPRTVRTVVRTIVGARPALVDPDQPVIKAAAFSYRKGFGTAPALLRSGGTIPVVASFRDILGAPTVMMGFALPDDRMHAPNEKFHLPTFFNGIATSIWFLAAFGATGKGYRWRSPIKTGTRDETLAAGLPQ